MAFCKGWLFISDLKRDKFRARHVMVMMVKELQICGITEGGNVSMRLKEEVVVG